MTFTAHMYMYVLTSSSLELSEVGYRLQMMPKAIPFGSRLNSQAMAVPYFSMVMGTM